MLIEGGAPCQECGISLRLPMPYVILLSAGIWGSMLLPLGKPGEDPNNHQF